MFTYKIIVAYDGTDYHGWQVQPDKITVAGVLEHQFKAIFGHEIKLVAASRTDAGVHALGQVARFYSPLSIDLERFRRAWNAHLPPAIHIRSFELMSQDFHPQHEVAYKIYNYHVSIHRPLPMLSSYAINFRPFDEQKLRACLQVFKGTHDFRSFCTGDDYENTIRTIDDIDFDYIKQYAIYRIWVKGPGFMRYMVRRIVGAALYVAAHKNIPLTTINEILYKKDPLHQLPTAPAHGLLLRKIIYRKLYDLSGENY